MKILLDEMRNQKVYTSLNCVWSDYCITNEGERNKKW